MADRDPVVTLEALTVTYGPHPALVASWWSAESSSSSQVWAVGRFDALASQAALPSGLAAHLQPVAWFAASGRVNGGLTGVLRAETRDEASANNLRDVIRGFLALTTLQASSRPDLQSLVRSLNLRGTGTTAALAFELPGELSIGWAAWSARPHRNRESISARNRHSA